MLLADFTDEVGDRSRRDSARAGVLERGETLAALVARLRGAAAR